MTRESEPARDPHDLEHHAGLAPHSDRDVRESFTRQALMKTLGATLRTVEPGHVTIALPFSESITQQHGFLHAGAIATILDSACGYAALSLMNSGSAVLSVEFKVNLLRPARGKHFEARASVVKAGKSIFVCQGDAYALDEIGEKHIASMTATMMRADAERGLDG